MSKVILVTGGARSGKSSYALKISEEIGPRRLFLATCPTIDSETDDRIKRHQLEREGRGWNTVEETVNLSQVLKDNGGDYDVILIDCITLWVNNILFSAGDHAEMMDDLKIKELTLEWLDINKHISSTLVCVTNEVGLGIVPENALARRYRDLVGTVNQTIGRYSDEAVLVSCGLPLYLKK